MASAHAERYFVAAAELAQRFDRDAIDALVDALAAVRERGGRLFIIGVGGGAGHASHTERLSQAPGIESYAPSDNVSDLTARTNDDGWDASYSGWLEVSRLRVEDALLVFSVGGALASTTSP
jgi:D-sedoheptulose 7-phosphate isomerase